MGQERVAFEGDDQEVDLLDIGEGKFDVVMPGIVVVFGTVAAPADIVNRDVLVGDIGVRQDRQVGPPEPLERRSLAEDGRTGRIPSRSTS